MSHFYLPVDWNKNPVTAPDALRHHLRVRRIRADQSFQVFNGQGMIADAQMIHEPSDNHTLLTLSNIRNDISCESPYDLVLIQGLAANEKMDWIIEKSVELGVKKIIPLQMDRSIVRLDDKKAEKKLSHWEQIISSSCEQCGRSVVPTIEASQTLKSFLTQSDRFSNDLLKICLSPVADLKLISILKRAPGQGLMLMIGPEGGFSPEENILIANKGFIGATIGQRILRTETAGTVAMSAVHALWGQL